MEKVWEELKKIEAKAEGIRAEAQTGADKIANLAQQDAEKLIANSKTHADEQAQRLYEGAIKEANRKRDEELEANRKTADELQKRAEKRVEQAATAVEAAVLGETKR